jgi:competence protein ComEC
MDVPVVQLAASYGAGLVAGLVFLIPAGAFWILMPAAGAVALFSGWRGALAAAAILGIATGAVVSNQESNACGRIWSQGVHTVLLRMHDSGAPRRTTMATVLHSREGCRGSLRVRLKVDSVTGGSRVLATGYHRGNGVFRATSVRVLSGGRSWRFALRDAVSARVRRLYGARAPLVEAVVLGRRSGIDPELRATFANSGLAHLLAISGLHVGVLSGWILMLARLLVGKRSAWWWSSTAVWCYVALLGFPAPATRAAAFVSIVGLAKARQRHPPPSAVLAVALLLVLAIDPRAATSVGAWLSAAAVWGTRAGADSLPRFRLLGASLGATLATAPITAWVFGAVAPIGVLANLLAVPLAGIAVPGLFLSLIVGDFVAAGTGLVLAGIELVSRIAAVIPGGHVAGAPGPTFAAPWILILAAAIWIRWRRPSVGVLRTRVLALAAAASWALAVVSLGSVWDRSHDLTLHFLSVGQGDAIAARTPRGSWVLVDAGPRGANGDAGSRVVLPFFRRHGVTGLEAVFVSHGDADHLGGVPAVVRALAPELVLDPGQPLGTALYLEYLEALDGVGAEWRAARTGDVVTVDSVTFEVIHPNRAWIEGQLLPNENSLVLRVGYKCFSALLTGDIGWPAEAAILGDVGQADVLKVGHHGSAGGTTNELLGAVKPKVAVISVGNNSYGHPAPAVLERLESRQIRTFRTDQGGTVTIHTDGRYFETGQYEEPKRLTETLRCLIQPLLRLSDSSWSRSGCIRKPAVSLPSCSTT